MNEKNWILIGTLGAIILGVIATGVAWVMGLSAMQGHTKEVIRRFFNFEITLFILAIIPIIGQLLLPIIIIVNIIYAIKAYNAATTGIEFSAPAFEIVK